MSTHRNELIQLQSDLRSMGQICDFNYDSEGWIESVMHSDRTWSPLAFAEYARERLPMIRAMWMRKPANA